VRKRGPRASRTAGYGMIMAILDHADRGAMERAASQFRNAG
jgi:hypothetical protein